MRKIIDLTGQIYGDLVVLSQGPRNTSGKIQWYCQCNCGNQILVSGTTLKNGKTNCGCKRKTTLKDISNQKFNRLMVLNRAGSDNNKKATWNCLCECGNKVIVRGSDLISGKIKSCGCFKTDYLKTNLIGQKFGKLTVLSETSQRSNNSIIWLCKCECGKEVLVSTNCLTTGNTQSCGCLVSKGENQIEKILTDNKITFIKQYMFNDLLGKKGVPLRFDFALFKNKQLFILIEFQGIQHYKNIYNLTNEDWNYSLFRDEQKRKYCQENKINLVEIKYNEDISQRMEEILCELKM